MQTILAQFSENTTVTLSVGIGCSIVGALVMATYRVANFIRDVRDEVKGLRRDLRETWSRQDQERWSVELERQNRNIALKVPVVPPAPSSLHGLEGYSID
jgi:hypothetical protein